MAEWSEWFENTATGERARICREPRDDGAMVNELVVAPGSKGPPPHMHPGQDEHFVVQSGVFAGKIGRKRFVARAGEAVFAPRMVAHAWWNGSDTEELRLLCTTTPALRLETVLRCGWEIMSRLGPGVKPPLLMMAVVCDEYRGEMGLPMPLWIQRPMVSVLAKVGRRRYGWVLDDPDTWTEERLGALG